MKFNYLECDRVYISTYELLVSSRRITSSSRYSREDNPKGYDPLFRDNPFDRRISLIANVS